ncbi:DUF805 domain-containing protein [Phycicoccus sp. DTK01]|uniref:DUF805 domain-containing protein n=1 Tax=Phycicoccus sp. DTK01 TaxID=2785745 RepID=UPI001A8DF717|nr:DUF805 domain-containing protein [Phycicoccus sp. DTK01]GIL35985.1 hypothetical protein PDTK01_20600 [Phycicoccus sp. DTK01]
MSLREVRRRRGWSQEQLADASGVSVRTIQRVEGGRHAGLASTTALAAALGVDPADLGAADEDGPAGHLAPEVTFAEALRRAAERWSDFEGRASRTEFWFALVGVLVLVAAPAALDERLGAAVLVLGLVPLAAVGTRRLRDAGQSPWWLLLAFAPMGFVVPLCLLAMPGRDEPSRAQVGQP